MIKLEKHTMGRGTIYLMISQIIALIASVVIHLALGRYLGPSIYGRLGIILSLLVLVETFVVSGIPRAVSKFTAENEKMAGSIKDIALRIQILFSMILLIAYFISAPLIADLLNDPELVGYIRLSAFDIPIFAVFCVYFNSLNGVREFGKQAKTLIIANILKVIAMLLLVALGFGLNGAIIGYIIPSVIGIFVAKQFCRFEEVYARFDSKKILEFATPMILFSLALLALMSMDLLFVQGILADSDKTGFYTSATVVARIPYYIFTGLFVTLLPSVSKSVAKREDHQTREYITHSLRYMLMILIPSTVLISTTSENLISLVYTDVYSAGGPPLRILIYGLAFFSVFGMLTAVINASGRPKVSMLIAFVLIPIHIILNLLLIPYYELVGAALAISLVGLMAIVLAGAYVFIRFKALVRGRTFFNITIASLVIFILSWMFPFQGILLLLSYLFFLSVYFGILWILRELKKEDLELVKDIIFKPKNI